MATANPTALSLWCHTCSRLQRQPHTGSGCARCGNPAAALEPIVDVVDSSVLLHNRGHPDTGARRQVSKAKLQLLPTVTVRDAGRDCADCMEALDPGAAALVTPCDYEFHPRCVMPWLEDKGTCPLCRAPVRVSGDQDGLVLCRFHEGRLGLGRRVAGCIVNVKVLDADGEVDRPGRVTPGFDRTIRTARTSVAAARRRDRGRGR